MAVIDLNSLKDNIKSALDTANTTTASQDLSNGLSKRVQKVLRLNVERIPVQSTLFPYVTCYITSRSIELPTFRIDQVSTYRKTVVDVKVVGAVYNSLVNDQTADAADEDCELLMENIEEVMRGDTDLSGLIDWHKPSTITYHNQALDDGAIARVGIMALECTDFYAPTKGN